MLPQLVVDPAGVVRRQYDLRVAGTSFLDQRDAEACRRMRVVEARRFEPRSPPSAFDLTLRNCVEVLDGAVEQSSVRLSAAESRALDQPAKRRVEQQALVERDDSPSACDLRGEQIRVVLGPL